MKHPFNQGVDGRMPMPKVVEKRKTLATQILIRTGMVLGLIGLFVSTLTFLVTREQVAKYQNERILSTKALVADRIQTNEEQYKRLERVLSLMFKQSAKEVAGALKDRPIESITKQELAALAQQVGMDGISLYVRQGEDIVIGQSNDQRVGESSRGWGYWFIAFQQLLKREPVSVGKGVALPDFWLGPTSLTPDGEYYKEAFYYEGTTSFLINVHKRAIHFFPPGDSSQLQPLLDKLMKSDETIREIGVINVEMYLRGKELGITGETEIDRPLVAGTNELELEEDREVFQSFLSGKQEHVLEVKRDGRTLKKFYSALPEGRALVIVVDLEPQVQVIRQLITVLLVTLVAGFVIVMAVVRAVTNQQLQPLREMASFLERVAKGELSGRLPIRQNNELGWLAGQINRMTSQLGDLLTELNNRANERITYFANYDALTNLPNRKLFKERLDEALETSLTSEKFLAVMFLDIDRFKNVNDSLGHAKGDQLLQEVAQRICAEVGEGQIVARIGGDEFGVLAPSCTGVEEVIGTARKILEIFEEPIVFEGLEFHLTTSVGIAISGQDGMEAEALLKAADTAMYSAKEQGSNHFRFYTPEMNTMIVEQLQMEKSLRHAIENEELILHYQPLVDIRSGQVAGMEALVRWYSKERGMVSPGEFIPLAERTGLIVTIGEWVLRTACRQNKKWQEMGYPKLLVAVNLSPRQFEHPHLVEMVADILDETGLEPQYLKLEITESLAMTNADSAIEKLHDLRSLGIRIAIDDFGTGYSSLGYLKKFPIDTLKIDRSFVGDIPADGDDVAIVTAIIAMAHNLKIDVVAEGVETDEQLQFLREQSCDAMQGYLFSKPVPAEQFERFLKPQQEVFPQK
jgi:diguanylate cyclase (GGDEF)-like protein